MPKEDTVRVLRLMEYIGPRSSVEDAIRSRTVKGEKKINKHCGEVILREAVLGETFEVIES